MKINDYEIQKIINAVIGKFNFNVAYSYLKLLAHPDMPDQDIEDFKAEASKLLYNTITEAIKKDGESCVNYSSNFKATLLNSGELHLDFVLFWEVSLVDMNKLLGEV